jgi:hypothetical protein
MTELAPFITALRESKKLFLAPLARYWLAPCCDDNSHMPNYEDLGYLPRLDTAIFGLPYLRLAVH